MLVSNPFFKLVLNLAIHLHFELSKFSAICTDKLFGKHLHGVHLEYLSRVKRIPINFIRLILVSLNELIESLAFEIL